MSSIVLLDSEGRVVRELAFVSLPPDFVIPDGMFVSWRWDVLRYSTDPVAEFFGQKEPLEANFYLGRAWAQINCSRAPQEIEHRRFNCRIVNITVQGASAEDVMRLRDTIMELVNNFKSTWGPVNNLNPKPSVSIWQKVKAWLGIG